MSSYSFSKKGKIKEIAKKVMLFGVLISLAGYLGKSILPFYLYIIPVVFLVGLFLINMLCILTTSTFNIDSLGISVNTGNNVSSVISWGEIERIEVIRKGSVIIDILFYKKGKLFFDYLGDYIENYDSLYREIIDNAKRNNIAMTDRVKSKFWQFRGKK